MYSKLLFVVGLAAVASAGSVALQCPKDNYYFTATGSQCEERGRQACASSLASCLKVDASKATLPVAEILAASTADCSVFTSCVGKHMSCVSNLARRAAADSEHACNEWGVALLSKMETVAHASEYEGSELQAACQAAVCQAQKMTSQVCPNMAESVCFFAQSAHAGRRAMSGTGSSGSMMSSMGSGSMVDSSPSEGMMSSAAMSSTAQSSSSSSFATKQAVTVLAAVAALALLL